jgi:ribosomal-protein-alanine N-acetyltransferase
VSVSESTTLRFERITEEYLPAVLEIESEAYPEPWTEGMFRDEIRNPRSQFYVAFLGDEIIGYGGYWPVLDEAHITSVTIKASMRGYGYGRRLLQHLLDSARELGLTTATLEVRESNLRARNLYASFGFQPSGLRKRYYPKTNEDAVIMLMRME